MSLSAWRWREISATPCPGHALEAILLVNLGFSCPDLKRQFYITLESIVHSFLIKENLILIFHGNSRSWLWRTKMLGSKILMSLGPYRRTQLFTLTLNISTLSHVLFFLLCACVPTINSAPSAPVTPQLPTQRDQLLGTRWPTSLKWYLEECHRQGEGLGNKTRYGTMIFWIQVQYLYLYTHRSVFVWTFIL